MIYPDPIYKYRQTLYSNHAEYYDKELFPAMVVKLKQGIGRLIRNELDTGCISILDSRLKYYFTYRKKGENQYFRFSPLLMTNIA